jgi:hypothetical protein
VEYVSTRGLSRIAACLPNPGTDAQRSSLRKWGLSPFSSFDREHQLMGSPMSQLRRTSLNIEKLMTGTQLPALPQSAIRLLELSQDPTKGPGDYAMPIESDPGLASQVLKFVNSSYFGFSREISTVKMAITLVGTRTIKNFAL